MLLVSYTQQYFDTSITVLTNQVWKLLIALFKVPNTGALTVAVFFYCQPCVIQRIFLKMDLLEFPPINRINFEQVLITGSKNFFLECEICWFQEGKDEINISLKFFILLASWNLQGVIFETFTMYKQERCKQVWLIEINNSVISASAPLPSPILNVVKNMKLKCIDFLKFVIGERSIMLHCLAFETEQFTVLLHQNMVCYNEKEQLLENSSRAWKGLKIKSSNRSIIWVAFPIMAVTKHVRWVLMYTFENISFLCIY